MDVARAADGEQFHRAGGAVVVADVEVNGHTVGVGLGGAEGKAGEPQDVPYAEVGIRDVELNRFAVA